MTKTAKPKRPLPNVLQMLLDEDMPLPMRVQILQQMLGSEDEEVYPMIGQLLDAARKARSEDLFEVQKQKLAELVRQMMEGPLRQATFVRLISDTGLGRRAEVLLPDGGSAFTSVPDEDLAGELCCGDVVWLEAQAKALLHRQPDVAEIGDEAVLERQLHDGTVEVQVGELGKFVYRVGAELAGQLSRGEADAGSTVIVCPRRRFAFRALPPSEGLSRRRFLSLEPVPDVVVERDIGAPPEYIETFTRHLRRELSDPGLGRTYGLRRSLSRLLTGVPGTGKSFSILGWWNRMYSMISESTGVPVEELPPRVMQLRVPEILSKWVGSSDRNIERFFAEAREVAAETLVLEDGSEIELPLLVIVEECDAWARERGEDPIHDRIQTTLLQNLDPGQPLFRERLVFLVCTTNTPQLIDSAFARRVGGKVESFGRLDRAGFRAVLEKQLARRPFRLGDAGSQEEARARCVADLVAWFHAANAEREGVVELTYVGQTNAVTKHHRDFLTAALLDRALQEACEEACDAEWAGAPDPGLSTARILAAIDAQVRAAVEQLTARTCDRFLTLPEGVRVASVRRIPRPAVLALELERAS